MSNLTPSAIADSALVTPGQAGYAQLLEELAPDEAIEHPNVAFTGTSEDEFPDDGEYALHDDEEADRLEYEKSIAWTCGLLKSLKAEYTNQTVNPQDPTEYLTLEIGKFKITAFWDTLITYDDKGATHIPDPHTPEYEFISMLLEAAKANYDEAHDYSEDPMGGPERYR